jgi:hypothetical protein
MMMAPPSTVCLTLVCENVVTKDGLISICAHWAIVSVGGDLPYCHACKLPARQWRLATMREIEAADRAFLRGIERSAES